VPPQDPSATIDRFFDRIDGAVSVVDRILGRSDAAVRRARGEQDGRGNRAIAPSKVVAPRRFRIEEVLDAQTGERVFLVTDGRTRAECRDGRAADLVRRGLEAVS